MSSYKRVHNLLNFFESTAAVFAFAGIIILSTLVVVGLNPKLEVSSDTEVMVAGKTDDLQSLDIQNLYQRSRHEVAFENDAINRKATLNVNVKSLSEGEEIIDLAKIINPNEGLVKVNIKSFVQGQLGDDLVIQIIDGDQILQVYSMGKTNNVSFSIDGSSEKNLKIKYIASQNINFSFRVNLEISY